MREKKRRRIDERLLVVIIPLLGICALFFFEWLGQERPLTNVEVPVSLAPKP